MYITVICTRQTKRSSFLILSPMKFVSLIASYTRFIVHTAWNVARSLTRSLLALFRIQHKTWLAHHLIISLNNVKVKSSQGFHPFLAIFIASLFHFSYNSARYIRPLFPHCLLNVRLASLTYMRLSSLTWDWVRWLTVPLIRFQWAAWERGALKPSIASRWTANLPSLQTSLRLQKMQTDEWSAVLVVKRCQSGEWTAVFGFKEV